MTSADITAIVVAVLGSGVISTIISNLFSRANAKQKKEDGVSDGVRWLMYVRLKQDAQTYIKRGSIRSEEKKDWIEGHSIYHTQLGGNGFLDEFKQEICSLPLE